MTDIKQKIEQAIEGLLSKIGIKHNGIEEKGVAGQVFYCIKTDSSNNDLLVSENGEVLRSINTIVGRMIDNHNGDRVRFVVDVNDYKKDKVDTIVNHAKVQADRVKELKYDVELQPSNGYERMLVHSALSEYVELSTVSAGEGLDRRVVIKWVG